MAACSVLSLFARLGSVSRLCAQPISPGGEYGTHCQCGSVYKASRQGKV